MTSFKVHFSDGDALIVIAPSPNAARDIARKQKGGGIVRKVKRVRS